MGFFSILTMTKSPYLLPILKSFFIKALHSLFIPGQSIDAAGIVRRNEQQFSLLF